MGPTKKSAQIIPGNCALCLLAGVLVMSTIGVDNQIRGSLCQLRFILLGPGLLLCDSLRSCSVEPLDLVPKSMLPGNTPQVISRLH